MRKRDIKREFRKIDGKLIDIYYDIHALVEQISGDSEKHLCVLNDVDAQCHNCAICFLFAVRGLLMELEKQMLNPKVTELEPHPIGGLRKIGYTAEQILLMFADPSKIDLELLELLK